MRIECLGSTFVLAPCWVKGLCFVFNDKIGKGVLIWTFQSQLQRAQIALIHDKHECSCFPRDQSLLRLCHTVDHQHSKNKVSRQIVLVLISLDRS